MRKTNRPSEMLAGELHRETQLLRAERPELSYAEAVTEAARRGPRKRGEFPSRARLNAEATLLMSERGLDARTALLEVAGRYEAEAREERERGRVERRGREPDRTELDRRAKARLSERGIGLDVPGAYRQALHEVYREAVDG